MTDDQARSRFMVLQMLRFIGVALAILGVAIIAGKIDLPREAGFVLVVIGVLDTLVVPTILARKWKTPR